MYAAVRSEFPAWSNHGDLHSQRFGDTAQHGDLQLHSNGYVLHEHCLPSGYFYGDCDDYKSGELSAADGEWQLRHDHMYSGSRFDVQSGYDDSQLFQQRW